MGNNSASSSCSRSLRATPLAVVIACCVALVGVSSSPAMASTAMLASSPVSGGVSHSVASASLKPAPMAAPGVKFGCKAVREKWEMAYASCSKPSDIMGWRVGLDCASGWRGSKVQRVWGPIVNGTSSSPYSWASCKRGTAEKAIVQVVFYER